MKEKTMMHRFWRWLHKLCEKKIEAFYRGYGMFKCERCLQWDYINDGNEFLHEEGDYAYLGCKNCKHVTKWFPDMVWHQIPNENIKQAEADSDLIREKFNATKSKTTSSTNQSND